MRAHTYIRQKSCVEISHLIGGQAVGEQSVDDSGGTETFEENRTACIFPLAEAKRRQHDIRRGVLRVEVVVQLLLIPTYSPPLLGV